MCDLVSVGFATLYCCIYAILNGYFTDEHERIAVSWSSTLQICVCLNWNVMDPSNMKISVWMRGKRIATFQ